MLILGRRPPRLVPALLGVFAALLTACAISGEEGIDAGRTDARVTGDGARTDTGVPPRTDAGGQTGLVRDARADGAATGIDAASGYATYSRRPGESCDEDSDCSYGANCCDRTLRKCGCRFLLACGADLCNR